MDVVACGKEGTVWKQPQKYARSSDGSSNQDSSYYSDGGLEQRYLSSNFVTARARDWDENWKRSLTGQAGAVVAGEVFPGEIMLLKCKIL
jgi:hypothetical protein